MEIETRLIVGLGNPGREYERTRHNVGFDVVDFLAQVTHLPAGAWRRQGKATVAQEVVSNHRVYLMKPQTYMNLSGEAVAAFLRQKPIPIDQVMVVADDINLPLGKLRLRPAGADGGHNGLKSLISNLRSREFPRLRVGVGAPADPDRQIDYVLGKFSRAEAKAMEETIDRAAAALQMWLSDGLEAAMNKFNG